MATGSGSGAPGSSSPIVVVGAGVSGLTTAICLAEAGREVRVWAAQPPLETTSAVAGGLWWAWARPGDPRVAGWAERSLREFSDLALVPQSGVRLVPSVTVGELPPEDPPVPGLRACEPSELPRGFDSGLRATVPLVDMPAYLDHLISRLGSAGVEIERRTLRALDEAGDTSVVVNCSGLGARRLAGDPTVQPVFGQVVVTTNPGLAEVFRQRTGGGEWTSWFPHPARVVCGGIRQPDRWDLTADPEVTNRILERCRRLEPRLRDAEVIDVQTGLRPARPAVRLEVEQRGSLRCVHNYGHGSDGVCLSWGCAREAARLALG